MKRRKFLSKAFLTSIVTATFSSAFARKQNKPLIAGKFVHMVFFWLKDETDVKAFQTETARLMKGINEVVSYHIGVPAGTPREVVDNSYTVSLIATFATKEDQDAYQVHPIHKKYVEDNNHRWHKVQIYDSWAD
jgi:hypothetical protein